MEYKINKYLYVSHKNEIVVIYNMLNHSIFAITKDKYSLLKNNELSEVMDKNPILFSAMEKLGVILSYDFDEIDMIKMMNRKAIFSNETYRLTINPTEECNFRCWYCYEKHKKGKMHQNTMDTIVNHIKLKIEDKSLKNLHLDWFGGEPLLYFDEIVYPLAKEIIYLLNNAQIPFANIITTNGYLINKERIEKFREISLKQFQITLDGNQEMHDKIRYVKNKEGSFNTIMSNINLLVEELDANIIVRINYTEKTLEGVNEIINLFSEKAKDKITILFQQVWQDSHNKYVSADENKREFEKCGINISNYELRKSHHVCYADLESQVLINHDGKIYKCTARDFSDNVSYGELMPSGEIQWNMQKLSKRLGNSTFENNYCMKCNYLPCCMGLCSQKMVELPEKYDYKYFRKFCLKDGVKKILEQKVEEHFNKINQKN